MFRIELLTHRISESPPVSIPQINLVSSIPFLDGYFFGKLDGPQRTDLHASLFPVWSSSSRIPVIRGVGAQIAFPTLRLVIIRFIGC